MSLTIDSIAADCVDCGNPVEKYEGHAARGAPRVKEGQRLPVIRERCAPCEKRERPGAVYAGLTASRMAAYEHGRDRGCRGISSRRYDVPPHLVPDYLNGHALGMRQFRERQDNPISRREGAR